MREAKAARRMARPAPDYPPLHRPDDWATITIVHHVTGETHIIGMHKPAKWNARCDQFRLTLNGTEFAALSNKTEALKLVGEKLSRPLGECNLC